MVQIIGAARTVRETTAEFQTTNPDGSIDQETIRIRYYPPTIAELKTLRSKIETKFKNDPDAISWISETLIDRLESLPDCTDAKGKPVKITLELLESIDLLNLHAINDAIQKDQVPKPQPEKSPNG